MVTKITRLNQLQGHGGAVYALAPSLTPNVALTGSADKFVASWDLQEGVAAPFAIKLDAAVYSLCLLKEKSQLLIGQAHGGIHVIDLDSRAEIRHLKVHSKGVFDLKADHHNGCFYAAGGDGCLSIWTIEEAGFVRNIPLSESKLRNLAISPDGKWLAIAGGDATLRLLDTTHFNEHHTIAAHDPGANVVAWHPNGRFLLSGGRDAHLKIWKADDFSPVISIPAHNFAIYSIVFSPNGKWFATGSRDKTIKIWDSQKLEVIARLERPEYAAHRNSVNQLSWSIFGDHLVSVSDDGSVMTWKVEEA